MERSASRLDTSQCRFESCSSFSSSFEVSENSVSLSQEGQPPHVFAFDNVGSTDSAESRG